MQHITVYTMMHRQKGLNEVHARFLSLLAHLLRPDASLDLTNVSLMKQYHDKTQNNEQKKPPFLEEKKFEFNQSTDYLIL